MSKSFITKLKSLKHKEIIIAVIAVIIMLIIYFSTIGNSAVNTESTTQTTSYNEMMTQKLKNVLSKIDGAGQSEVIISWDSWLNTQTSNYYYSSSKEETAVLPRALGVLVVCDGGDKAKVKLAIKNSVSILLDISAEKVIVYKRSK